MFTGIIETIGTVESLDSEGNNINLLVSSSISKDLEVDQSVSHDGVCLTITNKSNKSHNVTIVNQTIQKSKFSHLRIGSELNLERSMKINGRIDGHIVQGHVDDVGKCVNIEDESNSWIFTFQISDKFSRYLVEKGSISINGVSLTCFDIKDKFFSVAIIPHTYQNTNFNKIKINDFVNIEFDIIGKYVDRIIKK
ncbi:MAG: riboflavin synthase [Bacteroidota bacterium]|nr:riboflavin synthase [Bacteroidota bacterium]